MSEYIEGPLATVSANHVVSLRIVTAGSGWIVQALTVDWAIDLATFSRVKECQTFLEENRTKLNHQ